MAKRPALHKPRRRYAVLAPGCFAQNAKTAHGVIRYGNDDTVAVIDPSCAGKRVRDAVPYLQCDAPIVSSVAQALEFSPTSLLIGTAPKGGKLPPEWRAQVLATVLRVLKGPRGPRVRVLKVLAVPMAR